MAISKIISAYKFYLINYIKYATLCECCVYNLL